MRPGTCLAKPLVYAPPTPPHAWQLSVRFVRSRIRLRTRFRPHPGPPCHPRSVRPNHGPNARGTVSCVAGARLRCARECVIRKSVRRRPGAPPGWPDGGVWWCWSVPVSWGSPWSRVMRVTGCHMVTHPISKRFGRFQSVLGSSLESDAHLGRSGHVKLMSLKVVSVVCCVENVQKSPYPPLAG